MLAWLKGAKPTKDYSAEQQTMPARMEKKIYQQNNEKFLARAIPGRRGRNAEFVKHPSKDFFISF